MKTATKEVLTDKELKPFFTILNQCEDYFMDVFWEAAYEECEAYGEVWENKTLPSKTALTALFKTHYIETLAPSLAKQCANSLMMSLKQQQEDLADTKKAEAERRDANKQDREDILNALTKDQQKKLNKQLKLCNII